MTIIVKKEMISGLVKVKRFLEPFHLIEPFMLLLSFIIVMPILKGTALAWLFGLCALYVGTRMAVDNLSKEFKNEIRTEELIQENKDNIKDLQKDIQRLNEKLRKKNKLNRELERCKGVN